MCVLHDKSLWYVLVCYGEGVHSESHLAFESAITKVIIYLILGFKLTLNPCAFHVCGVSMSIYIP
jgi:hypothetical protein